MRKNVDAKEEKAEKEEEEEEEEEKVVGRATRWRQRRTSGVQGEHGGETGGEMMTIITTTIRH